MTQTSAIQTEETAAPRRRLVPGFLGVVAAVALLALTAVLLLPHDTYARYQSFEGTIFERLGWVYDRLAHDDTPIDVLIVGSSRTARGANVEALQAALAARGMKDVGIANVSIPASGFDWRLTVIREALRHHPEVKLVIWELVERFPRDGHQAFAELGTAGEVLRSPWLINRNFPENLAKLPYRQMELALASAAPGVFGLRPEFDPETYLGSSPDHRSFNDPDWQDKEDARNLDSAAHATAVADESRRRRREITPPVLPEPLQRYEFGVSRHYVQELAELGREHGFQAAFLFLPFYDGYEAAAEADWVSDYGHYWGAPFLREDPANYADAAHASSRGVERITPWLADWIAAVLDREQRPT